MYLTDPAPPETCHQIQTLRYAVAVLAVTVTL